MSRSWTPDQKEAIEYKGSSVVVAAAAGSGKTAVLTERVIRRITDAQNPADISRMLIVTFTKAAAEELRARIRSALGDRLSLCPYDSNLRRQLINLQNASISTIHGFCSRLIRDNFQSLGLPTRLRVAEEAEAGLLQKMVMEQTLNDFFEGRCTEQYPVHDFDALCDNFLKSKKDDSLGDIFLSVYNMTRSYPRGIKLLADSALKYRAAAAGTFFDSEYASNAARQLSHTLRHLIKRYNLLINKYAEDALFREKYLHMLVEERRAFLLAYLTVASGDVRRGFELYMNYSFKTAASVRGEPEWKLSVKALREDAKKRKHLEIFTAYSDAELSSLSAAGAHLCEDMYSVLACFESRFRGAKLDRKLVDFGDLEHYTYKLLCGEDGEPSALAMSVRNDYEEIYIDEYQDVNELQDSIFRAISQGNLFIVGDVKQSIYGFRGAVPQLFSEYRKSKSGMKTVFMSENFRCAKPIIDFSNALFYSLFSFNSDIPYTENDALVCSKTPSGENEAKVSVVFVENDVGDGDDGEAQFVAREIAHLLKHGVRADGERYSPGDFAILMRSAKSYSEAFEQALASASIPVYNGALGSFFESSEVLMMICFLSAVDNPTRDIYLAGIMQSPVFSFTLDELITIRGNRREVPLITSVREYNREHGDAKTSYLLEKLDYYRYVSQSMPTDKFIWFLYRDTGILSLAYAKNSARDPELRKANLMLLYDYARKFESGSFKGLYNFINYLNDIIERNTKFENAKIDGEGGDSVKIMTVHKSKGLEFEVVFVVGADRQFVKNTNDDVYFDKSLGFAFKIKDSEGRGVYKTPMYASVLSALADEAVQEEARVLYVAVTRARQRLYITAKGNFAKKTDKYERYLSSKTMYSLGKCSCMLDFINLAIGPSSSDLCDYRIITAAEIPRLHTAAHKEKRQPDEAEVKRLRKEFENRFSYEYPYAALTKMPKKVSVSKLYPEYLDEYEDGALLSVDGEEDDAFDFPAFLTGEGGEEATAAEKGSATHLFMQFCDFSAVKSNGARNEAERLRDEGFIPEKALSMIYYDEAEAFFTSDIYGEICECTQSGRIFGREYRFNVNLDASLFSSDESLKDALRGHKLLVQGVVDVFFENRDGTLTLLDYKTDRLSRRDEQALRDFSTRHTQQLRYYKTALERITGKTVSRCILYAFSLSEAVEVFLDS